LFRQLVARNKSTTVEFEVPIDGNKVVNESKNEERADASKNLLELVGCWSEQLKLGERIV